MNRIAPAGSGVKAVRSGRWSDRSTWGGRTPSGAVVIPKGIGVIYDVERNTNLASVRVDGCLEFARRRNTKLKTNFLYVAPGGELYVGSRDARISPSVKTEIVFPDTGSIDVRRDPRLLSKGLVSVGRAEFHGSPKTARVKTQNAPRRGETVIRLSKAPQGWRNGDRLVLTGTNWKPYIFINGKRTYQGTEDEELTITRINGAAITVTPALKFNHNGPLDRLKPYLVNYSRNIRIATENADRVPVHQRGHTMFMSHQTQVNSVELHELGRTDKSRRAFDLSDLTATNPASNIKGRYSIHLHKVGFPADDAAPVIRNIAAWGSPGWGVGQHTSKAFLYDNATYNTFGAGFVAESGDETGAWVGNTAIKSIGVRELIKNGPSVNAFDLARTGDGFWMQGRLVRLHQNVAAGFSQGTGFVYMTRGEEKPNQRVTGDDHPMPESFRFIPNRLWEPTIQQFTDNEVMAANYGFQSLKANPRQQHDLRSINDGFTAWNVARGVYVEYTSHYTVSNATLIGQAGQNRTVGFGIGNNAYDIVIANSLVRGFVTGADLGAKRNPNLYEKSVAAVIGVTMQAIRGQQIINRRNGDIVLGRPQNRALPSVRWSFGGGGLLWANTREGRNIVLKGTKSDKAGNVAHPVGKNENVLNGDEVAAILDARGYYKLPSGERAFLWPEYITDRVNGDIVKVAFPVKLDAKVRLQASKHFTKTNPKFLGTLNVNAAAPTARNDGASTNTERPVVINVLGNDASRVGGALKTRGHTNPRNGIARARPDGRISYRSFPGFKGTDTFYYWAEDKFGKPSRAKVTVRVR